MFTEGKSPRSNMIQYSSMIVVFHAFPTIHDSSLLTTISSSYVQYVSVMYKGSQPSECLMFVNLPLLLRHKHGNSWQFLISISKMLGHQTSLNQSINHICLSISYYPLKQSINIIETIHDSPYFMADEHFLSISYHAETSNWRAEHPLESWTQISRKSRNKKATQWKPLIKNG